LDYDGVRHLQTIHSLSRRFRELAVETAELLDLFKCVAEDNSSGEGFGLEWLFYIALAMDVVLLLLMVLFNKKKVKVKIN
jgi:hypothetical protein